jgi:capsular exopolysaccharide synthesis family protein
MNSISPHVLGLTSSEVSLFAGRAPIEIPTAGSPPIRRVLHWATRWRWVLLAGVTAGALAGAILTVLLPRQYTSTSRLEISRETARVVKIDSVEHDASIGDQEFYQTQYGLLRAQVLAERVARDLHVVDDPKFFNVFGHRDLAAQTKLETPSARAKRNEIAGRILLQHVSIAPVRGSRLVDIHAVTPDPVLSQRIAQTWAQDFIASELERHFEASSYARRFLEAQINQLRQKLEASERDAVGYAAAQGIINLPPAGDQAGAGTAAGGPASGRSLVTDDLGALNAALDTATAERIQAQSRLLEARRPDASNVALSNEAISAIRQKRAEAAAQYSKLMVQFEPNYPEAKAVASQIQALDAAIGQEENRIRTSLEQTYAAALAREHALAAHVNGLKGDLTDLRRRSIQYNIYQRDADTNRELYNALLQRYKEIGVAAGVGYNNIEVVDGAKIPDRPSSPKLLLDVILGLLGGAALGAAAAGVLEQTDEGISDPADVEEKLGMPLLGIAPRLRHGEPLDSLRDARSKLVEGYLAVQANLELSTAHGTPKSLAVISTRPREGKSITTIALAQSLARARRKVVVVDADLRAPSIHSAFGLLNSAGVSNFLSGADDIEALLRTTDHEGLVVMTAGPQPPNAADLLMGDRLRLLIQRLQERFDHVVVDSPPLLGLADAPLVAAAVDSVIFAVEARTVPSGTVRVALNRLKIAHVRVLGAVLTKFEGGRAQLGYHYDYGYGYGYSE